MAMRDTSSPFPPLPRSGSGARVGGEGTFVRMLPRRRKAATLRSALGQAPGRHFDRTVPLSVSTLPAARRDQAACIWAGLVPASGGEGADGQGHRPVEVATRSLP